MTGHYHKLCHKHLYDTIVITLDLELHHLSRIISGLCPRSHVYHARACDITITYEIPYNGFYSDLVNC